MLLGQMGFNVVLEQIDVKGSRFEGVSFGYPAGNELESPGK